MMSHVEIGNAKKALNTRLEAAEVSFHEALKEIARERFRLLVQCAHELRPLPAMCGQLRCDHCGFYGMASQLPTEAEAACPHTELKFGHWPDETFWECKGCGAILNICEDP